MFSAISAFILRLMGWKFEGDFPRELKKFMLIAIPHTSNWDFPMGLLIRSALKIDIKFVGKDSLFKPPFGGIFKALGGYPVDRSRRSNFVDAVVDIYNEKEEFRVCIAPEGTRKKVTELKTGFYYIAKGANIPIVMIAFDWGSMTFRISEPFYPTDDKQADFAHIKQFFKGTVGKNPELSFTEE